MNRPDDLETLREGRPFIESAVSLILFLRFGKLEHGKPEELKAELDLCDSAAAALVDRLEEKLK